MAVCPCGQAWDSLTSRQFDVLLRSRPFSTAISALHPQEFSEQRLAAALKGLSVSQSALNSLQVFSQVINLSWSIQAFIAAVGADVVQSAGVEENQVLANPTLGPRES